jgi:phosphoribosyl 1,2-cyclic phosphodiesterase
LRSPFRIEEERMQITVLGSGSAGNASLLRTEGFGLLLDIGLGPRQLAGRMAAAGASWRQVHAALLTHTHSDHWNERTLTYLLRLRIPLYCHVDHHEALLAYSPAFMSLQAENLVRRYEPDQNLTLSPGLHCRPLRLRHDGGVTCGFRFEARHDFLGPACALGYVADLGCWGPELVRALGDVDLLALEFNHDVGMERNSGRSPRLIARVLGDDGHLSNAQAAALLRSILLASTPGRLRRVIQLHLSRECNHPDLAAAAAQVALGDLAASVAVHTACQDTPSPTFQLIAHTNGTAQRPQRVGPRKRPRAVSHSQPWLPGMAGDQDLPRV